MTCIVGVIDQDRGPFVFGFNLNVQEHPQDGEEDSEDLHQFMVVTFIEAIREFLKNGGFARYEEGSDGGVISWSASGIGSSTALHWLPHEELAATYRHAYEVLTDGGVLLNGDHMRFSSEQPTLERLSEKIADRRIERQPGTPGLAGWDAWWQGLRQEPGMHELFAEREPRFAWRLEKRIAGEAGERQRELALAAGFRETGSIWQNLDNRILIAVK
jgi:hypothetical protein